MKRNFLKAKIAIASTAIALASSVTTSAYLNNIHEDEIQLVEQEVEVAYQYAKQKEDTIIELQETLIKKSEQLVSIESSHSSLSANYDTLKENYETTKLSYQENLEALNAAEKKLEAKKTKAISEKASKQRVDGDYSAWKKMYVESTAYTKYENGDELGGRKWGNITKSGQPVRYGVIAVDTSVIPLGTEVYIPALNGVFVALDTGSAVKGNMIDIYFNTLDECIQWGRKYGLEVYVNM